MHQLYGTQVCFSLHFALYLIYIRLYRVLDLGQGELDPCNVKYKKRVIINMNSCFWGFYIYLRELEYSLK